MFLAQSSKYHAMKKDETIGSIVAQDIRAAHVFKQHQIDFCCGGGITLEQACTRKGIGLEQLIDELEAQLQNQAEKVPDFTSWKAGFLCDYIENEHHTYVKQSLPLLIEYADRVAKVHGETHAYLITLCKMVHALSDELIPHLTKEENVLFPYVKRLESGVADRPVFGTVQNPIQSMINEHDAAGDLMKALAKLSGQFTPPDYACNTWKAYYHKLQEFEEDLYLHVHLENNILFPKAIALEKEIHEAEHH